MKNYLWLNTTTVTRSTSVVPVLGGAFGPVCADAFADAFSGHVNGTPMRKRTADAITAAAHKGMGPATWSPPTG